MKEEVRNENRPRDPLTGENATPASTGIGGAAVATAGAAVGGLAAVAAGATAGSAGGPIGAAIGGLVGAVVGTALEHKAEQESNPTIPTGDESGVEPPEASADNGKQSR